MTENGARTNPYKLHMGEEIYILTPKASGKTSHAVHVGFQQWHSVGSGTGSIFIGTGPEMAQLVQHEDATPGVDVWCNYSVVGG
jgi:hypothetical protein